MTAFQWGCDLPKMSLGRCHFLHHTQGASDSARYKALGNSMAVPVMRWIGERIAANC